MADNTGQLSEETQRDAAMGSTYTLMSKRFIKVHSSLQKLIVSLRTAVVLDEWKLDKQQTSHHDIMDSFRLALCNYEPPKNNL